MSKKIDFPGAAHYFILQGKTAFMVDPNAKDSLFHERSAFKENVINDLAVRLQNADHKINLILTAKEKYEEEKRKYLSAKVSLECSILEDALTMNLLEVAEILAEFVNRLRTKIPAQGHLFKTSKKIQCMMDKVDKETYTQARSFLFPKLDGIKNNGKVHQNHFHEIANRLEKIGKPIETFRNKVLAHKYDKERFDVQLSFEQYSEIKMAFMNKLNAIAIVGSFFSNDVFMRTGSPAEIERTAKWLTEGLLATAVPYSEMN